jgi:serine/threonine protein kinase
MTTRPPDASDAKAPEPVTESLLAGRYAIVRPLGRGAFGHTLLAHDRQADRQVALKVLSLDANANWKAFELFEREATVLRHLRHSGVPAIYDTFRAPWNGSDSAWLAMEYIEGETLAECIEGARTMDLTGLRRLFMDILGILDYLHSRVPPILHRDIKPSNVILRPDGSVALVDFGSVRNVVRGDEGGSTIAGTYGYMPYEQYMGQATPASDLYSAAATMLHVITGRPPSEWMTEEGRVQVPEHASCGEPLRSILVRLLSPLPTERFQSAREVMDAMLGGVVPPAGTALTTSGQVAALARRPSPAPLAALQHPVPRPINDETRALVKKISYTSWQLMSAERDPGARPSGVDIATIVFFSIITAGVLPLVMWGHARSRRKKVEQFLRHGTPAVARILGMEKEKMGFEVLTTLVRYEFEADGRVHRDADNVLPTIAVRWDVGDMIHVLYRPDKDFDSIIISTS